MVVFQNMRELHRIPRSSPPMADRLADGRERMATLNEMLAAHTNAANRAAAGLGSLR